MNDIMKYRINRKIFIITFLAMNILAYSYFQMEIESPYIHWFFTFFVSAALILLVRFRCNDLGFSNTKFLMCCVLSFIPIVSGLVLIYLCLAKPTEQMAQEVQGVIDWFSKKKR